MDIIINELSLSGFTDDSDFANKYKVYTHPIFKLIENVNSHEIYNIHLSKTKNILSVLVTPTQNLQELIYGRNKPKGIEFDIFRSLKSTLSKLFLNQPFWEDNQQHSCENTYKIFPTTDTCDYSIAEACERDKMVISFFNDNFSTIQIIPVIKNSTEQINICNIANTNMFWDCIIGKETHQINNYPLNWDTILGRNSNQILFPFASKMNEIIDLDMYFRNRIPLSAENRIPLDKRYSKIVATMNYWKHDNNVSSKNRGRTIYYAGTGRQKSYISVDTENGRFELFDKRGKHKGEYNYFGKKTKEAESNRSINV